MLKFYFIYSMFTFFSNFTNAIMPQLFEQIHLSSYIYGLSFALMSLFTFLTSLIFSKLLSKYPIQYLMGGSLLFYTLGQYFLKISTGVVFLMISRILAGIGIGGLMVASLTYLLNHSTNSSSSLSIYAIIQALVSSIGFFVGSIFGQYSLNINFNIQLVGCLLCAFLSVMMLKNTCLKKETNSIRFYQKRSKLFYVLILSIFFTSLGYFMHDQWLNYYFKNALYFTPFSIGYYRLAIGVVSLFMNVMLIFYLMKIERLLLYVEMLCALFLFLCCLFQSLVLFLIMTLLYNMLTVIFLPLQQRLMTQVTSTHQSNASIFNATRSIGMCVGPLIAGIVYPIASNLPLMIALFSFLLASMLLFYFFKNHNSQ